MTMFLTSAACPCDAAAPSAARLRGRCRALQCRSSAQHHHARSSARLRMQHKVAPKEGCPAAGWRLIMCALWDWIHKNVAVSTGGMERVEAACFCMD